MSASSGDSGCNSPFYAENESPLFGRFQRPPKVQFQELCTVASSSDSSPIQEVMTTPHLQLKKLRKELAHDGDIIDELEKELANQISIITEKEGQICQLHHRVERMLRQNEELEKDHKAALLELQEKNERLLHRVHEVLKQCQELKTDNSQKERKLDELTEENGTLSVQVRYASAQLATAKEEVVKLSVAHESAQVEWKSRVEFLEKELYEAVTQKNCLGEEVQILQGKISVLEDELLKAQSQERGEILGPIIESDNLKQEVAELSQQLAQLQDTISGLEKDKAEVEALLTAERSSFEKELERLREVESGLSRSVRNLCTERDALQEALQNQTVILTGQITTLESEVARLQHVEGQLMAEIKVSADLRQQGEALEKKILSLDQVVFALQSEIQVFKAEKASKQETLDGLVADLHNATLRIQEYENKMEEHQKVVEVNASLKTEAATLQHEIDEHVVSIRNLQVQISSIGDQKMEQESKVGQAMTKIESLQSQIQELSEQIYKKEQQLGNLRTENDVVKHELQRLKDHNDEINETVTSSHKKQEDTIEKLQKELSSVSSTSAEKQDECLALSALVASLKEQICLHDEDERRKRLELTVLETEHNVLKEQLSSFQNQLSDAKTTVSQKESELVLLKQEFSCLETMRAEAKEFEALRCEELENNISEHQAKVLELSSVISEKKACVKSLQHEISEHQLKFQQSEDLRMELKDNVENLREQLEAVNYNLAKEEHLVETLNDKVYQLEFMFQQKEREVVEWNNTWREFQVEQAALENKLEETSTTLAKKDSDLLQLQQELCQHKELEALKHEELKRMLSDLQVKVTESSALASEREDRVLALQNEMKSHQLKAKETEDELRTLLEEKLGELDAVSQSVAEKECLLGTLRKSSSEMEEVLRQKEKDVNVTLQAKQELEKRLLDFDVEKKRLSECHQSLDTLKKERDSLFTEVTFLREEISRYQVKEIQNKQDLLVIRQEHDILKENFDAIQKQFNELTNSSSQKMSQILLLQNELCYQDGLRKEAEELETAKHQELEQKCTQHQAKVLSLQNELSSQILAKQTVDDLYGKLEEKLETLQRQVETAKLDAESKEHQVLSLNQNLKQIEVLCRKNEKDTLELRQAKEDLENRNAELVVEKQRLEESRKNMETLKNTNEHLSSLVQSLQRECDASQRIRAELEAKVNKQCNSIHSLEVISQQREKQNEELQEQLRRKSETVEHYKSQVEKAKTHYNSKKQLLVDAQDINKCLENSLEATKREVKALETELTLAKMETDQAKTKEKNLAAKVKSLEAQMTDRQQQEKKMLRDDHVRGHDAWKETSTNSLEFELNDSLNTNSDSAVPGESSTPLQRSSERLADKRRVMGSESLETLYFTPLSQQAKSRKAPYNNATKSKLETSITSFSDLVVDSAKKTTESARRRRTTQFINITMTKNSEDSFAKLQSAQSQPNLAVRHSRPPTMDLSEDSSVSKADTLQSLPGYRRSMVVNVGPQRAASTFCIGAENEPEHAADDWMRIAQLQARNKACLPHLKSSYPLESRPSLGPSFMFTDEDMRSGDPDETIRRASMIPAQIMDSVSSHRFSLAPGLSSSHGATQSHRATMLPSQIRSSTRANAHVNENTRSTLASKRHGPNLQNADTPEAKKLASCFPRPITPRAKSNNQNQPSASPVERRQSVMFSVLNTPKSNTRGDSRLQRGLNRLRNSARKSPAAASRALRSSMASNSRTPDSALRKSPRNHTAINKKMKFRF